MNGATIRTRKRTVEAGRGKKLDSSRGRAVKMTIATVDLISNTCFPVLAAEELGFFRSEGLDAHVELFPMLAATKALRSGAAHAMAAGSVHDLLTEFPKWEGAKLLVALAQGTPWLLVVRADLPAKRGDLNALRGLRLTAADGPDLALRKMLADAKIDSDRDVEIVELPGAKAGDISFGVFASRALEEGKVDGFWANAMGAEAAVRRGTGKILMDVRRGDDPAEVRRFTFAGLATTDALIEGDTAPAAAAVRAVVRAQRALRAQPELAAQVGCRRFPAEAGALIATVVERDLPFYDPVIHEDAIAGLNRFAQSIGYLSGPVPYERVVAVRFRELWKL
jgi:ABC-type nitrate/sulfonate/bicarbonate transport system substrate-binding protein